MATNVGNLAIIISGNASPFNKTIQNVKNTINQASGDINNITINPPRQISGTTGLQFYSFGALLRSAVIKGFGGGLAGGIAGATVLAIQTVGRQVAEVAGAAGHLAAQVLVSSFEEGMKVSRLELGVGFLAGSPQRAAGWMKELRGLSQQSGFSLAELGNGFRQLAGSSDDLDNIVPRMRAITEISAGIGADAEQMHRFALAVSQVIAAGRFEAQELNQLTEAGLPIKALADTAGMSVGQFRAAVKDGAVSISILDQTLNRLALSPGGRFFGMLEEQGRTAVGQVMRVQNAWLTFQQELGKGLMEGLKNTGWLNAPENGLNYLLEHKAEVNAFLENVLVLIKEMTAAALRLAGAMYEIAQGGNRLAQKLSIPSFIPGGLALDIFLKTRGAGLGTNLTQTGDKLADDFLDSFNARLRSRAANPPTIRIDAALSNSAKSLVEGMGSKLNQSPPFAQAIRDIGEATRFFSDQQDRAVRALHDAAAAFANRGGPFGDLLSRLYANKASDLNMTAPPWMVGSQERNMALYEAFIDAEKELGKHANQFPKAMELGSVEAARAINKAIFGSDQKSYEQRVLDVLASQKAKQDQIAKDVAGIAAAAERLGVVDMGGKR